MPTITPSEEEASHQEEKAKRRRTLGCLGFTVIVLLIATAVGLMVHFLRPKGPIPRKEVVGDCHPQPGADKGKCEALGCTWQELEGGGPSCSFPSGYGYKRSSDPVPTLLGQKIDIERIGDRAEFIKGSPHVSQLTVEIEEISKDTLRVLYRDREGTRHKVPEEALNVPVEGTAEKPKDSEKLYDVEIVNEPQFGIRVTRRSTKAIVFDTTVPGFIFSEQYLQITTRLASAHLYGLGEHNHRQFKHDMNWRKWTLFTRDVAPVDEWNLYGHQAMYMNLENDGNANGLFLLNSNAMDIVLQPDDFPAATFHVTGGVLDFYIFLGPTPENVVQQYTFATGRPMLPPYWMLGFQLSRWDYGNLTMVEKVVDRNRAEGIPLEVQYGDIDYMESKYDFTVDKDNYAGLSQFVDKLHNQYNMKYIVILDHCIGSNESIIRDKIDNDYKPYTEGKQKDIFIRDPRDSSKFLEGEVWPGVVHYPDFTKGEDVIAWWKDQCDDLYDLNGGNPRWRIKYDGLWIDMNEPSNFVAGSTSGCENNKWNNPPYVPNILGAGDDGRMYDKTICMDAMQKWGLHYNVHSLYGHSMAIVTYNTLKRQFPEKRPVVLTRSQFSGTQKYAAHWLGDNQSQWRQIPWSIVGMLEYSLFGFSFTGADICGFWYAANEQLCQRWMQLGAFYPYSRNHNAQGWPDQDPAAFSPAMISVSRDILITRYKLLPFLYTLLWDAHTKGSTVARPLMHEFANDNETWAIDRQFLWGPSFMISPALEENQDVVHAYIPSGRWYDYYGGKEVKNTGSWHNITTPLDKINLHVRGGHIIPYQHPEVTTAASRRNPFGVIVALGEEPYYEATGKLVWDDHNEAETNTSGYKYTEVLFNCTQEAGLFKLTMDSNGYNMDKDKWGMKVNNTEIWGLSKRPSEVKLSGNLLSENTISFDETNKVAKITAQLALDAGVYHEITWKIIN